MLDLFTTGLVTLIVTTSSFIITTVVNAERPPNSPFNDEWSLMTLYLGTHTTGFAGTIASADPCGTTYALTCTNTTMCPQEVTFMATAGGDSTYQYRMPALMTIGGNDDEDDDNRVSMISESCTIKGTSTDTSAVCNIVTQGGSGRAGGTRSVVASTTTVTTVAGTNLAYAHVPITGNLQALAAATGRCMPTATADGAAKSTKVKEVYKVIVPAGLVLLARML